MLGARPAGEHDAGDLRAADLGFEGEEDSGESQADDSDAATSPRLRIFGRDAIGDETTHRRA